MASNGVMAPTSASLPGSPPPSPNRCLTASYIIFSPMHSDAFSCSRCIVQNTILSRPSGCSVSINCVPSIREFLKKIFNNFC
ncbi:hypothetical protein O181_123708 [Austropuccinia psidii MF-1]|uniref:Uncharacterized protein n=1 Tax=Austropuccinia psidii MF-1 TaxID=1389203 RepID=A0A9Q3KLM7_9BASI|nr:hypothetical protein [Austropuccinia psidii MF-1]